MLTHVLHTVCHAEFGNRERLGKQGTRSAQRAWSICRTMLETKCSAGASLATVADAAEPLRLSFRQTLLLMAAGTSSSMMSGRCSGCDTNADTSKPGSAQHGV